MLPRPRSYTTRSGRDRQQRAELFNCRNPCAADSVARTTDRAVRMRTGEVRPKTSDKTELTNKLLVATRNSHYTIHSNPALTRCKYNNYITIQRSFHPNFYTQVDKNAACHLQDAKNMRSSRITYDQINVYLSILLKFLPFSPLSSRREQQKNISKSQVIVRKTHFVASCRSISSHLFTHTSFLTPFLRPC